MYKNKEYPTIFFKVSKISFGLVIKRFEVTRVYLRCRNRYRYATMVV